MKTQNQITIISILFLLIGVLLIASLLIIPEKEYKHEITIYPIQEKQEKQSVDYTVNNGIYISEEYGKIYDEDVYNALESVKNLLENKTIRFGRKPLDFFQFYSEYFDYFTYSDEYDGYMDRDYIQTPEEFIKNNFKGDCDDSALYLGLVAKSYNLSVKYMMGFNEEKHGHTWNKIKINNQWLEFGSTKPIICVECISKKYKNNFEVTI